MFRLALADLRDAWSAWLGVIVTFVASGFSFGLIAVFLASLLASKLDDLSVIYYATIGALNFVILLIVAISVINSATALVVSSRRGAIARLALAGATPGQLVGALVLQLSLVSAVGSIGGAGLAVWASPAVLSAVGADPSIPGLIPMQLNVSWIALVVAVLLSVGVGVLGGRAQAIAASRIPPVEALRQSVGVERTRVGVRRKVILVVLAVLWVVVVFVPKPSPAGNASNDVAQGAVLSLALTGVLFATAGSTLIGWLTRQWTRVLPIRSASWVMARLSVIAKASRLTRTLVPIMFAVGLTFGLLTFGDSYEKSIEVALGHDVPHVSLVSLLSLAGIPVLLSLSGAVGNLVMMGRSRAAELAMGSIVGATPGQLLLVGVFESVIVTVTATLLAAGMTVTSLLFCAVALPTVGASLVISVPWSTLGLVLVVCWLATLAATVAPSVASLFEPPQRVVARLVAD